MIIIYIEDPGAKTMLAPFLRYLLRKKENFQLFCSPNVIKMTNEFELKEINKYNLVVIYREAIPTRSVFFEKMISKRNVPIVLDFDDAIWIKDVSQVNKNLSWFKNEKKIEQILPLCTHVTCGNKYLSLFPHVT